MTEKRTRISCPSCGKTLNIPWNAKLLKCSCGFSFSTKRGKMYKNGKLLESASASQSPPPLPPGDGMPPPLPNEDIVWYISVDGNKRGPMGAGEIVSSVRSGEVTDSTLVWKQGWSDWKRIYQVKELGGTQPGIQIPSMPDISGVRQTAGAAIGRIDSQKVKKVFRTGMLIGLALLMLLITVRVVRNGNFRFWENRNFSTPSGTVQTYVRALRNGNSATIVACFTERAAGPIRRAIEANPGAQNEYVSNLAKGSGMKFKIVREQIKGNQAAVRGLLKTSVAPDQPMVFELYREHGKWKISNVIEEGGSYYY